MRLATPRAAQYGEPPWPKRASENGKISQGFRRSPQTQENVRAGLWSGRTFVCRYGAINRQVATREGGQGQCSQQKCARHDQIELLTKRGVAQKVMERCTTGVKSIVHQNRRDDAPAGEIIRQGNNDRKRSDDDGVNPERGCCPSLYEEKGKVPARPDEPQKQRSFSGSVGRLPVTRLKHR